MHFFCVFALRLYIYCIISDALIQVFSLNFLQTFNEYNIAKISLLYVQTVNPTIKSKSKSKIEIQNLFTKSYCKIHKFNLDIE